MTVKPVADAHVDVLMRMDQEGHSFSGKNSLQAGLQNLLTGGVATQVFALYVSPKLSSSEQLSSVLRQIDKFFNEVVATGKVAAVTNLESLQRARELGQIAGMLSLEGGGCLHGQTAILRCLATLGVRGMGLTWNNPNELADGCGELRGAGLTSAGRGIIEEMIQRSMWIDIAHLADRGVADIFEMTDSSVMASHANARQVHAHRRNLTDEVIAELIRRNGWMGITFEASFVAQEQVGIDNVFRHVDHVLSLGGENTLGFGSDFDGTSNIVSGLSSADHYRRFAELVMYRYGDVIGEKILFQNFESYLERQLPESP